MVLLFGPTGSIIMFNTHEAMRVFRKVLVLFLVLWLHSSVISEAFGIPSMFSQGFFLGMHACFVGLFSFLFTVMFFCAQISRHASHVFLGGFGPWLI